MEFFQTVMGRTFFEGTFPALIKAINRHNDLKEKELELKAKELALKEKEIHLKEQEIELIKKNI